MSIALAVIGLLLDIVGAYLLAEAVFFKNTRNIVDDGYVRTRDSTIEFYGALRVHDSLRDKYKARVGLVTLLTGFGLQLLAQLTGRQQPLSIALLALIPIIVTWLIIYLHSCNKRDTFEAAVELADRICERSPTCSVVGLSRLDLYHSIVMVKDGIDAREDIEFITSVMEVRAKRYTQPTS